MPITKIANDYTEGIGYSDYTEVFNKATRRGDAGLNRYLVDPELAKARTEKMVSNSLKGAAGGAGLGALAGFALSKGRSGGMSRGALIGAGFGAPIGIGKGGYDADKEYLAKKGIRPKAFGFKADITPEARERYLGT